MEGCGPLTINDIAKKANIDPSRIGSPMYLLTSLGWFDQDEEGRYRINRFSEQLRTGQFAGDWCVAS